MLNCNWVEVGNGKLTLWHFLGKESVAPIQAFGVTRVVTLLTEDQGAFQIRDQIEPLGIAWTWLPIRRGKFLSNDEQQHLRAALPELSGYLDNGEAILIHCSAGIHRTGLVAFALLRWRGYDQADALKMIEQMRLHTREGIQSKHLRFGNRVAEEKLGSPPNTRSGGANTSF